MAQRKKEINADLDPFDAVSFDALDLIGQKTTIEKQGIPVSRCYKRRGMIRCEDWAGVKTARAGLERIPRDYVFEPGSAHHIISDGIFELWDMVPAIIAKLGKAEEFYGSTWKMRRQNVLEIFRGIDGGTLGKVTILTGLFFKRHDSAVYSLLLTGLTRRGQRFAAFENHAKVMLLKCPPAWITLEGSANFTGEQRREQYTITNDKNLYQFHQGWMEEALNG